MVAGGTGVPFGTVNEKKLYFYTIYKNAWCVVEPKGELPMPCYGQVSERVAFFFSASVDAGYPSECVFVAEN